MKLAFLLATIISLWTATSAFAQVRCESIFVTAETLGDYGVNAESMAPYYIAMFRTTQIVSGLNSRSGVITQDILNSASSEYGTIITKFRPRGNLMSQDGQFRDLVNENIEFVLQTYSERRDWSPDLRIHLKKEAEHYAEQSTYIEVRKLNQDTYLPEGLIGTMKIVKVGVETRLKKLPLEADFLVTMPSNNGKKFEPANFVVDKDQNKLGTSEIFAQLILHAREQLKDPGHEPGKMMYYTPADRLGVKMYGKLGFSAVPGFEAPIKEGDKDWWMIGSSAENLATLPQRLAQNKAQWSPEDVEWMSELVKKFEGLRGTRTEIESRRTRDVINAEGAREVQEMGVFITEPFTYNDKNYRRLDVHSIGGGDVDIQVRIPDEQFPLQNGWRFKEQGIYMFYQDGIFKVQDPLMKISLTMKVDGAFKKPEYLKVKERHYDLRARF
ncbi:hypothetical protein DOM22_05960 [Bdellovibrio sp. ZAP7]|uniref:hypothetical protein n=1 Tax=Bdellovibrio sp. ZAP7 TaxID=2231053 RepID=UPI00115AE231|nr:hypothetical protein [Bdellovibrio sp. ZAP7]QDK44738.1 hypothetical protein DOM22_05960 [Bdellovibrio sp. ZAP7]